MARLGGKLQGNLPLRLILSELKKLTEASAGVQRVELINPTDISAPIVAAIETQTTTLTESLQKICDKFDAGITVNSVQSGQWTVSVEAQQFAALLDALNSIDLSPEAIAELVTAFEAAGLSVSVTDGNITVDGTVAIDGFQDLLDAVTAITSALDETIDVNALVTLTASTIDALVTDLEAATLQVNIQGQDNDLNVNITNNPFAVTLDFAELITEIQKQVTKRYTPQPTRCISDANGDEIPNTGVFYQYRTDFFGNDIGTPTEVYSQLVNGEWVEYILTATDVVGRCDDDLADRIATALQGPTDACFELIGTEFTEFNTSNRANDGVGGNEMIEGVSWTYPAQNSGVLNSVTIGTYNQSSTVQGNIELIITAASGSRTVNFPIPTGGNFGTIQPAQSFENLPIVAGETISISTTEATNDPTIFLAVSGDATGLAFPTPELLANWTPVFPDQNLSIGLFGEVLGDTVKITTDNDGNKTGLTGSGVIMTDAEIADAEANGTEVACVEPVTEISGVLQIDPTCKQELADKIAQQIAATQTTKACFEITTPFETPRFSPRNVGPNAANLEIYYLATDNVRVSGIFAHLDDVGSTTITVTNTVTGQSVTSDVLDYTPFAVTNEFVLPTELETSAGDLIKIVVGPDAVGRWRFVLNGSSPLALNEEGTPATVEGAVSGYIIGQSFTSATITTSPDGATKTGMDSLGATLTLEQITEFENTGTEVPCGSLSLIQGEVSIAITCKDELALKTSKPIVDELVKPEFTIVDMCQVILSNGGVEGVTRNADGVLPLFARDDIAQARALAESFAADLSTASVTEILTGNVARNRDIDLLATEVSRVHQTGYYFDCNPITGRFTASTDGSIFVYVNDIEVEAVAHDSDVGPDAPNQVGVTGAITLQYGDKLTTIGIDNDGANNVWTWETLQADGTYLAEENALDGKMSTTAPVVVPTKAKMDTESCELTDFFTGAPLSAADFKPCPITAPTQPRGPERVVYTSGSSDLANSVAGASPMPNFVQSYTVTNEGTDPVTVVNGSSTITIHGGGSRTWSAPDYEGAILDVSVVEISTGANSNVDVHWVEVV